jgi:hypothetical protein
VTRRGLVLRVSVVGIAAVVACVVLLWWSIRARSLRCGAGLNMVALWQSEYETRYGRPASNIVELCTLSNVWDYLLMCGCRTADWDGTRSGPIWPSFVLVEESVRTNTIVAYCPPVNHLNMGGMVVNKNGKTEWVPIWRWRKVVDGGAGACQRNNK